ncbi:MAG: hypothetical protein KKE62_14195 [Proteobacteria bacterium]|nr:hypothetical protein [Pseudomonadota bacterium]MBU1543980.1 hypothetical protein [Pseudomonadota bacterium]MBU2431615.1 hypothetical protein [Pseudomonadota bacterium]MBU2479955.1 hypothetical protein [Pseudomonadota bacterium]
MGTSSAYGGPGGVTPLVPSWLEPDDVGEKSPLAAPDSEPSDTPSAPEPEVPTPPNRPEIPALGDSQRFTGSRNNFTRFAHSGGTDRASLGRAVSGYVSTSSGGARQAAQRMGASRGAGTRLLNFLTTAQSQGATAALRALNLEGLSGRPIDEVFLGLADYICPNVGTVDEGIAREAFIETIIELTTLGVTDLDALTPDQMQTVFELYATHAIEARLCNDIGTKVITAPADAQTAIIVQNQLHDFIRNAVSDALTVSRIETPVLTQDLVLSFVDKVYERAFEILEALGDTEADQ